MRYNYVEHYSGDAMFALNLLIFYSESFFLRTGLPNLLELCMMQHGTERHFINFLKVVLVFFFVATIKLNS